MMVNVYSKFLVNYQTIEQIGYNKTAYLFAVDDDELNRFIEKVKEFPVFHEVSKNGTIMQTINSKNKLTITDKEKSHNCYFYWINRKYYEFDEQMKKYLLEQFEMFEEYEICDIIYKQY